MEQHPKLKRARRVYSDTEITQALAVLDSNGGNLRLTSRQTGIPERTVGGWRQGESKRVRLPAVKELREQAREDLADIFERVARLYLKQALRGKVVVKTSGQSAVIASATATDKMRLLRDQGPPPTEAAKTAAEAIKQAAAALVALSKSTGSPIDLTAAEERMKEIQFANTQLASEATQ